MSNQSGLGYVLLWSPFGFVAIPEDDPRVKDVIAIAERISKLEQQVDQLLKELERITNK